MRKIKIALIISVSFYTLVCLGIALSAIRNLSHGAERGGVIVQTKPGMVVHIEASESAVITTAYPITYEPEPMARVASRENVYAGPGYAYSVIGSLAEGEMRRALQRTSDNAWWQICCVAGQVAWVPSKNIVIEGNSNNLPAYIDISATEDAKK